MDMIDIRVEKLERTVVFTYVIIDDHVFEAVEIEEALAALSDEWVSALIDNVELADIMVKYDAARETARGSWLRSKNYNLFESAVERAKFDSIGKSL